MIWKSSTACTGGACVEVAWTRSSFCANGACVEVGWRKSTFSADTANCVEVAQDEGKILVRDSKNPDSDPVSFMPQTWMSTVLAPVMLDRLPNMIEETAGGYAWQGYTVDGFFQRLLFTAEEWQAFCAGVKDGQFNVEALAR